MGYSAAWGGKESDTTERLSLQYFEFKALETL